MTVKELAHHLLSLEPALQDVEVRILPPLNDDVVRGTIRQRRTVGTGPLLTVYVTAFEHTATVFDQQP